MIMLTIKTEAAHEGKLMCLMRSGHPGRSAGLPNMKDLADSQANSVHWKPERDHAA